MDPKVTSSHLEKPVLLYPRVSTPYQVENSEGSLILQEQMKKKLEFYGWSENQIIVEARDLGKSGATVRKRVGWKEIQRRITRKDIGAVSFLESSRAARNIVDFAKFVRLCKRFKVLIITNDGVFDPNIRSDALSLGFFGVLSEDELSRLTERIHGARVAKATEGTLKMAAPWGYINGPKGELIVDPDPEIQHQVHSVFQLFRKFGSIRRVTKEMITEKVLIRRRVNGTSIFTERNVSNSLIRGVLSSPTYAGTYWFGATESVLKEIEFDPEDESDDYPEEYVRRPIKDVSKWVTYRPNSFTGYITHEEYEEFQRIKVGNSQQFQNSGIAREGAGLLVGRLVCGRCGHLMQTHSAKGPAGNEGQSNIQYYCNVELSRGEGPSCLHVPAYQIDPVIESVVLQILNPASIQAMISVHTNLEHQRRQREIQRHYAMSQAIKEVSRTKTQFEAISVHGTTPEAAEYGLKYIEASKALRELQDLVASTPNIDAHTDSVMLSEQEQEFLQHMTVNVEYLWSKISNVEKKNLIRILIKKVTLYRTDNTIRIDTLWDNNVVTMRVIEIDTYIKRKTNLKIVDRVRELINEMDDERIAEKLTEEGYISHKGHTFTKTIVQWIRRKNNIYKDLTIPRKYGGERGRVIAKLFELTGHQSNTEMATSLNQLGLKTRTGKSFSADSIAYLIKLHKIDHQNELSEVDM